MSQNFVSRLTIYALVSGIETDLREAIDQCLLSHLSPEELLGESFTRAATRLEADIGLPSTVAPPRDFLDYLDLGDLCPLMNQRKSEVPQELSRYITDITPLIGQLVPIRNRIAHQRPLHADDFAVTIEVAQRFSSDSNFSWSALRQNLNRLKAEPGFVLALKVPTYDGAEAVRHNLPLPDFDETGFLGRGALLKKLISLCRGPYPVISVFGDGGVGKTSLVLKAVYDLIDEPNCPFCAVVWTSAKAAQLTGTEIKRISGAIADSLGVLHDVAQKIGAENSTDPLEDILAYLRKFNVLLILDNLETVLDQRIRGFLEELGGVPSGSKVLITSRYAIGAYDYPLKLNSLDRSESVQFLRSLAKMRGVEQLTQMANKLLEPYCARLFDNPLWIKWFVSAVQAGTPPEKILSQSDLILDFCQSNVFEYLSEDAKTVIRAMLSTSEPLSAAELAYFTECGGIQLSQALAQLMTTSMVIMSSKPRGNSYESRYLLSDVARKYLAAHHPLSGDEQQRLAQLRNRLIRAKEEIASESLHHEYSAHYIEKSTKSDVIVSRYLIDALRFTKAENYDQALVSVEKARELAPGYFEVFRIDAWIKNLQRDTPGARQAYEAAVEIEPRSSRLRLFFGQFLLRALNDADAALDQLKVAASIDSKSIEIQTEIARCYLNMSEFQKARAALNEVLNRTDASEWNRRKAFDTYLQAYEREAYQFAIRQCPADAIRVLRELRDEFAKVPQELIDERMKKVISRGLNVAEHLGQAVSTSVLSKELVELSDWYVANGSRPGFTGRHAGQSQPADGRLCGEIIKLVATSPIGFIIGEDQTKYFFHRNHFSAQEEWNLASLGCRVTFSVDVSGDERGPEAVQIRLLR